MINQLLAEYIICGIVPALEEEELIKFFNRSLKKKIRFLFRSYEVKEILIKDFDARVITFAYEAKDIIQLERGVIAQYLSLLTNKNVQENIFICRAKPEIRKIGDAYRCHFRGAFVCKQS